MQPYLRTRAIGLALTVLFHFHATQMSAAAASSSQVVILCYHDLSRDSGAKLEGTVSPEFLRSQIRASKAAGWTFLRLSEVVRRLDRGEELPGHVMVLTFDDGYRSFLDFAVPILREEDVPATLAIVTSFVDRPPPDLPPLMSWEQIRNVEAGGMVEIAAHSHDLHRWVTSNPYRDTSPSAVARRYLIDQARYEDREEYRERIRQDMTTAQEILREKLGHPVSVYAWPYGEHNEMVRALAAQAGFDWTLALGARAVDQEDLRLRTLPRVMVTGKIRFDDQFSKWLYTGLGEVRAAQVDLDPIFDTDETRFRRNLEAVVARVRSAGATHVILQACPDLKGDARFREAWFMNHQIPVKADIWSMAAAKLHHAGLKVWVRAPVLNLPWVWKQHRDWRIKRRRSIRPRNKPWYFRISPDLPEARRAALDFYADLAVYLPIDGVLFDDDAYMLPNEALRQSGVTDSSAKSDAMREMIEEIMRTVRAWRPLAKFGRNIYAPAVEHQGVYPMFSQDLDQYLRDYDLTVVMAYAHMEGHGDDAPRWIHRLVGKTLQRWTRGGPAPVLFKLQAYDWASRRWLKEDALLRQALEARRAGAVNLGVYPVSPNEGPLPEGLLSVLPTSGGGKSSTTAAPHQGLFRSWTCSSTLNPECGAGPPATISRSRAFRNMTTPDISITSSTVAISE